MFQDDLYQIEGPAGGASDHSLTAPSAIVPAPAEREAKAEEQSPTLRLCPTCDEPFVPQHPARASGAAMICGAGFEPIVADTELMMGRATVVMLALAALGTALAGWFALVARQ